MSIDMLHSKIRKSKNPLVIDFGLKQDCVPQWLKESEGSFAGAYSRFCSSLMEAFRKDVPAVRFSFGLFALQGQDGLKELVKLLHQAKEQGFYVILDGPEILSPWDADRAADSLFGNVSAFDCDALVISPYIGSDALKPFLPYCKEREKALFAAVRSPNKTASEIQDLLTGTRLVQGAAADIVKRYGEQLIGKHGYSNIGALTSAGAPESLRNLRNTYPNMFMLVDGLDYPSGNAKNCSYAFDQFGYGAVVCAGPSITAAWKEAGKDKEYVAAAVQAADRIRRNITRYITIL